MFMRYTIDIFPTMENNEIEQNIEQVMSWYSENRESYQSLAIKVKNILEEILCDSNVNYLSVECRAKTLQSLKGKIVKKIQNNPRYDPKNINDLAGIRIITYVQSDLDLVRDLIRKNLTVIESKNKTESLGVEQVGYRSEHFIAELPPNRTSLMEYEKFKGCRFEIQLRTILEHSWAEIEHDRNYKFSGELPREIKRRFSLLSAILEMADNEFESISKYVDDYKEQVLRKTQAGDLDMPIDKISLKEFLNRKFSDIPFIEPDFGYDDSKNTKFLIQSLWKLNINTIQQLDSIIPPDIVDKLRKYRLRENYFGLMVDILIIKFKDKYFKCAWDNYWESIGAITTILLEECGVDMNSIIANYGIFVDTAYDDIFE